MYNLAIQIVRFVDGGFPGWVECELIDAAGRRHIIKDKVPIFTVQSLEADSEYPVEGSLPCEVLERFRDGRGQELVRVSTEVPCHVESTEGLTEFTVRANLIRTPPDK
jgi:hypothetical protein